MIQVRLCIKFADRGVIMDVELPFMPAPGMMIDPFPRLQAGKGRSDPLPISSAIWTLASNSAFVVLDGTHLSGVFEEELFISQGWRKAHGY